MYHTGNYIQCPVTSYNGKEYEKEVAEGNQVWTSSGKHLTNTLKTVFS